MNSLVRKIFKNFSLVTFASLVIGIPPIQAHHSVSMYDSRNTYTYTGVVTRVNPAQSHLQIFFVPLDEERQAVIRDAAGEPEIWSVEMSSAAQSARNGISVNGFPPGTIFTVSLHPLRTGKPAGSRVGELYKCPADTPPAEGLHCDSVLGNTSHGKGDGVK